MSATAAPNGSRYVLGVDVGGTFTDGMLVELETGEIQRAKVPTTPDDQSRAVVEIIYSLGVPPADIDLFCHGTTVGLNAFLQRKGSKVGLICTEGTRDLLDMGRLTRDYRSGLYDPTWKRPQLEHPVIHRRYVRETPGRLLFDGSVHAKLDEEAVRRELIFLRDEGIEAVAVCLMNSYANLDHERRVLELIEEILPDVYVQSSAFRPVVGEYSRTAAVVVDAYTGSVIAQYLERLQGALRKTGFNGPAVITQINGGVRAIDRTAESFPAYTLQSGPVSGILGAEYYGRNFLDVDNLLCIDIGGTSTDLGLVVDGVAQETDDWEVEWALPLGVPAVDVRSVGAGGGSLIHTDAMGTLQVGPESAGAVPGPACYRLGGERPTITDAHLVRGAIRPAAFLGGQMELDAAAAAAVVGELAETLAMDPHRLAVEAVNLMNATIEAELAKMAFERGVDLRRFSLMSFGGAGSLHAVEVARMAGISEVIVPQAAGGFCAMGAITAPPKVDQAIGLVQELADVDVDQLVGLFDGLESAVRQDLEAQGVAPEEVEVRRSLYGMYTGQSFSNELALESWPVDRADLDAWKDRFDVMYEQLYGYSAKEIDVTVTTLRVVGTGPRRQVRLPRLSEGSDAPPPEAAIGTYPVYVTAAELVDVPFYRRSKLLAGNRIPGPTVLEDDTTTVFIPADAVVSVDHYGNLRIELL
jgi:N-methylhydantoinase A